MKAVILAGGLGKRVRPYTLFLPKPMLTRDQVMLLRRDNVVGSRSKKLHDLGVSATPAEAILPTYLARFRRPRSAMLETS